MNKKKSRYVKEQEFWNRGYITASLNPLKYSTYYVCDLQTQALQKIYHCYSFGECAIIFFHYNNLTEKLIDKKIHQNISLPIKKK